MDQSSRSGVNTIMHICQLISLIALTFWVTGVVATPETDELLAAAGAFERQQQYDKALAAYEEAEALINHAGTGFERELFAPLMGKGRSLRGLGNPVEANDAFEQALHVLRRNEGVYTLTQLEVIDQLTEMALVNRDPMAADTQQQLAHYISERQYGQGSPELLPSDWRLVRWYIDSGQYSRALRHVTATLEALDSPATDPRRIEGHLLAADARRLQGICCSEKPLQDALAIVEANPDLPADLRHSAYLALGDAFIVSRKPEEAAQYYSMIEDDMTRPPQPIAMSRVLDRSRQSLLTMYKVNDAPRSSGLTRMTRDESLSADYQPPQQFRVPLGDNDYNVRIMDTMGGPSESDKIYSVVGRPFQFYTEQLRTLIPIRERSADEISKMEITMSFTVETDGRLTEAVIVESNAPTKVEKLMRDVIDNARYRPGLEQGIPVRIENVTVTQSFPMPPVLPE
jgi:hypothetical protein